MTHKCLKIWKLFSSCVLFSFIWREPKSTLLLFLIIFCLVSPSPFCENNTVHYVFTCKAPECAACPSGRHGTQKHEPHSCNYRSKRIANLTNCCTSALPPPVSAKHSANSLSGLVFANYKYIYLYYTPMHTKILSVSVGYLYKKHIHIHYYCYYCYCWNKMGWNLLPKYCLLVSPKIPQTKVPTQHWEIKQEIQSSLECQGY